MRNEVQRSRALSFDRADTPQSRRLNTKSLLISNLYFPPQAGGISHFMGSVAASLGPERVCCLTSVSSDVHTKVEHAGVRVYRSPAAFSRSMPVQAVGLGLTLLQIMLRERPHIVQLAMAYEGSIGLWLRRLGLPFVIYAHGNEILDAIESDWPKPLLALRQAACVLANSQFTLDLVQKAGVDSRRTAIVHPGCDVDHFHPLQTQSTFREQILGPRCNDRVLLTVGLETRKGHDMVIRALPMLLRAVPDVTY